MSFEVHSSGRSTRFGGIHSIFSFYIPCLAFLLFAFIFKGFANLSSEQYKDYVTIPAVVEKIESYGDDNYLTIVSYEYEGEKYSGIKLNAYSSFWDVGTEINIKCNPQNPKLIGYDDIALLNTISDLIAGASGYVMAIGTCIILLRKM